ncbi:MAG: 5-oxoprolinase subunit PxpB [Opitutae bacterium]|nr:5-oxoprolinase subunit PxpB [Opitutae bacterium]
MHLTPLGDSALIVHVGDRIDEATHARVQAVMEKLEREPLPAVTELVPAYTTVTLFYNVPVAVAAGAPADGVVGWLGDRVAARLAEVPADVKPRRGRVVEVPVCYDTEFAPDLAEIAQRTGLAPEKVVELHQQADYLVYLVGFAPGFPYMGGLPAELAVMPRRATPRTKVAPGSVGIVGAQCCIYPLPTPGGWNLLGRTPRRLFDPQDDPPAVLRAGDRVKFRAITREEFEHWREK